MLASMAPSIGLSFLFGSLAALSLSCGNDCVRELKTEVQYTGAHRGTAYTPVVSPGGHSLSGGSSAFVPGSSKTLSPSGSCWEMAAPSEEHGWQIEGWIDLDDDKKGPCHENVFDATVCHPDP